MVRIAVEASECGRAREPHLRDAVRIACGDELGEPNCAALAGALGRLGGIDVRSTYS
jgi:hypothetical protein